MVKKWQGLGDRIWGGLVPALSGFAAIDYLVGQHSNRCMWQGQLDAVYYQKQFGLVILVVRNKRSEPLVNVLVHDFSLTIGFLVVCR